MGRVMKKVPLLVLCALITAVPSVWANWVQDGVAICTAAGNQSYRAITSDGAGGAIITWLDHRSGNGHIYAQRVNTSGDVQWTTDGIPICTATENQSYPAITSDGAGGAIVTWYDSRTGNPKIYAQRVSRSGAVQWRSDGIALGATTSSGQDFAITSDGAGGAIVAWLHYHHLDYRRGNVRRIYVQRVNSFGVVQWSTKRVALCTATGDEYSPRIVSDSAGGAIVTWLDRRSLLSTWDIYAQHVNASGAIQWDPNGVPLCAATGDFAETISDGAGGAIVTWNEERPPKDRDIYAQRVNASGTVQWAPHGVALCTAKGDQAFPTIVYDGAGGAIVTWYDKRSKTNCDIYAQRVDASGAVQWTTDGVALCTATGDQMNPTITSDGASGAIVTWCDDRTRRLDIYAQRVNASGTVQWATDGVALCTATWDQLGPRIVYDGAGGAIVVWEDQRSKSWHIYALRVSPNGSCAVNRN